jgi:hypothetical protein
MHHRCPGPGLRTILSPGRFTKSADCPRSNGSSTPSNCTPTWCPSGVARSSKRISTPHTQSAPRSVLHPYTSTRPFGDALYHNAVNGAKVPTRLSAQHTCLNGVTRHVRAWSQTARHQDGARPMEADPSPRHGVPGQSDRPVASSHNLCCTQDQQRHSPWYPAHACTHEDKCTILEAMRAWIKKLGVSWYAPTPSRAVRTFARPPPSSVDH